MQVPVPATETGMPTSYAASSKAKGRLADSDMLCVDAAVHNRGWLRRIWGGLGGHASMQHPHPRDAVSRLPIMRQASWQAHEAFPSSAGRQSSCSINSNAGDELSNFVTVRPLFRQPDLNQG